jgi:hypothetical protein
MSANTLPRDLDGARADGAAFGHAVGQQTASDMAQAIGDPVVLGQEGVGLVLARANALADAGLDRDLVEEWTEAAAASFNEELSRAAALLQADGGRH